MHNFPLTEKSNYVVNIRVIRQAEDIIIGKSGFLFCCDLVRTTFLAIHGIQLVCNAVDLILQTLQDFLKALSVHVSITGRQFGQHEHLMEDSVNFLQGMFNVW